MDTETKAPEANPDVGLPAIPPGQESATKKKRRRRKSAASPAAAADCADGTHIDGAALVPDLDNRREAAGVVSAYRYWVGVTASCPVEHIDCAGINFPKVNENIVDDPKQSGKKVRVPVIGSIVELTEEKVREMRERLPFMVIRYTDDPGEEEQPGTGKNVGKSPHRYPRRGQNIRIPTSAEMEDSKKRGRPTHAYIPRDNDVPAARFMFAVLCTDQENGNRSDVYPDTIETAGLSWPEQIER